MKFKDLRDLIYCECEIIKGKHTYYDIHTHEKTPFDEDEVIGIRHSNSYLIVSLRG